MAVMGGSSLSFACATWTEGLPDWIDAHARAFAYFGGAARLLVPDNPKVAVIKACFYDPQANRTYAEMAACGAPTRAWEATRRWRWNTSTVRAVTRTSTSSFSNR
jgi:transposase